MISWDTITRSRRSGGLEIRDLRVIRKTIMSKRLLPPLNKDDSSWCRILNNQKTKWHPWMDSKGKDQSWYGKAIAENLKCLRDGFKKCVGNGRETTMWTDPWIEFIPLKLWPTYINVSELEKLEVVNEMIEGVSKFTGTEINKCHVCNMFEDESTDILIECEVAKMYWKLAETKLGIELKPKQSWAKGSWLEEGKLFDKVSSDLVINFIAISLWLLWKNRCQLKYNSRKEGLHSIFSKACREVLEYSAVKSKVSISKKVYQEKSSYLQNDIKSDSLGNMLFCDGSWKEGLPARAGFMLTDGRGRKLIGSNFTKTSSPLKAELQSIWYGLDNVRKKKLKKICVSSDCKNAIDILNRVKEIPWNMRVLVENIGMLGDLVEVNRWKFIKREENIVAHAVARIGLYDKVLGTWRSKEEINEIHFNLPRRIKFLLKNFD
ncbi:hypothetical protein Cni_G07437 [Canna indica]|uniref:RNase H type-1 domain-containing protein n=1 Tax=Canna indica TaxID=4628 RepID=A0AAQ3Q6V2_9LILI|nr:hypothetical protein Cni_G07437 [Canna indica]